jgi:mannose-6-phosphate isomerase-like protein (cupin superfamily)
MTTRTTLTPAVETKQGPNYTAASLGKLAELGRFELTVPQFKRGIRGKVFLKPVLGLTGMEASLTVIPAGVAIPFTHRHRTHEELYVVVGGRGQMQVDGETFDLAEGSVVRVAPAGARVVRAAPDVPLQLLCVQAREGSVPDLEAAEDGERVSLDVSWPTP